MIWFKALSSNELHFSDYYNMEIKSLKKHTTSDYSHFHLLHKKYTFCGFQLEFVSIGQVINHMTCYNLSALIIEQFI